MTGFKRDEYDFDSSDEEDIRNTVGNVPMQWYDNFPHVGYDASGRPIMRPTSGQQPSDAISEFLKNSSTEFGEQNAEWRTIVDPKTGQSVVLSDRDLEIVTRMSAGKGVMGDKEEDIYKPWDEFFTSEVMEMPVTAHPPQKRSFIPSLLDRRRVGRITHAIKMGWIRPRLPAWALEDPSDLDEVRRYAMYMTTGKPGVLEDEVEEDILGFSTSTLPICVMPDVWADQDDKESQDQQPASWRLGLPASLQTYRPPRPRPYVRPAAEPLPSHAESYNPPPEYLLSEEEERKVFREWRERVKDNQASRVRPIMPRRYASLRQVPFSECHLREREERIRDLLMAARVEQQKVHTTPEALLPQIPSLEDLRPYPSQLGIEYKSHNGRVTGLSVSPCGQWLASVSPADGCLRIWEVGSNFCFRCYRLAAPTSAAAKAAIMAGGLLKPKKAMKVVEEAQRQEEVDYDEERPPSAHVAWNPNPDVCLVAAAFGRKIFVINPALGDRLVVEKTEKMVNDYWKTHLANSDAKDFGPEASQEAAEDESEAMDVDDDDAPPSAKRPRKSSSSSSAAEVAVWGFKAAPQANVAALAAAANAVAFSVQWGTQKATPAATETKESSVGAYRARSRILELSRLTIELHQECIDLSWHGKGDYLLSLSISPLASEARSRAANRILLHRVSRVTSQAPFASATAGAAEEWLAAAFHPSPARPLLFVAARQFVHTFDLVAQKELPKLKLNLASDHLVAMAIHPSGNHVLAGTSGSRFVWFDADLGHVPFKKLGLKGATVNGLSVHARRPLVSVGLDDGALVVLHGKVSDDLMSLPLIVPVRRINTGFKSISSCVFHNRLPNVYAGGECGTIRQYVPWN